MHYSSDTGEKILSDTERHDTDIADDDINSILALKDSLNDLLEKIERLTIGQTLHIKRDDLIHCGRSMHEQLDELLASDYDRLTGISGSIAWPTHIGDYRTRSKRIITNPATLQVMGDL